MLREIQKMIRESGTASAGLPGYAGDNKGD
ncbi:hypothetical protein [Caudoviricetes sp.]|nr:hypothetical protein [Caudoviricetes sp.]